LNTKVYIVHKFRLNMYGAPIALVEADNGKQAIAFVRKKYGPGTYEAGRLQNVEHFNAYSMLTNDDIFVSAETRKAIGLR
jgi:hypothetical protein